MIARGVTGLRPCDRTSLWRGGLLRPWWRWITASVAASLLLAVAALPERSLAEQASQPASPAAGGLDVGSHHACALLDDNGVRCWGFGANGRLGHGDTNTVGDDESPSTVRSVDFGPGRVAKAISAGEGHTCAVLDDGSVRCWGFGGDGRLGYGNQASIADPASAGPVDLGAGRTATAISAGGGHTCAVLDDGSVRCWGYGGNGRLGYNSRRNLGDDETPGSVGPVDLGPGRRAKAIAVGLGHSCALLHDDTIRCWGFGRDGRLGYGNTNNDIGDDETPATAGPVDLGTGRTATAISAGRDHTCAVLDNGMVRCWGYGGNGRLGYANTETIGDNESPGVAGPVDLGESRSAEAISAGDDHTCTVLDDGNVRCWGYGSEGRLGYANTNDIGDDEAPGSAGPVNLGAGRTAVAISAGARHTCARLDDSSVRCWGYGGNGRLAYCNQTTIGDDEVPGSAGPVALETGSVGSGCPTPPPPPPPAPSAGPAPTAPPVSVAPGLLTAKLALARATINRRERVLDVLAPITSLASGRVGVQLHAAGRRFRFSAPVNARDGRIRFRRRIPRAQAALGTGIVTIAYRGDEDTRAQQVRLRAASRQANLRLGRPRIEGARLRARGTIIERARGVVRLQLQYVAGGQTKTVKLRGRIEDGRWEIDQVLSQEVREGIARRTGTVHSYTLFTGYYPRRVRGEMRSFQVLGPR